MPRETKRRKLDEACSEASVDRSRVLHYIRREWIVLQPSVNIEASEAIEFDDEDLARIRLILELQKDLGVNDEGVDVILHLLDQIHALRAMIGRKAA